VAKTKLIKKEPDLSKLTDKERRFCLEYLVDCDATRALMAAGYNCKSKRMATNLSAKMLKKPHIRKVVGYFEQKSREDCEIRREEVLWNLLCCTNRDGKQFVDETGRLIGSVILEDGEVVAGKSINDLPDELTTCIDGIKQKRKVTIYEDGSTYEEVTTELKLVPKAAALDMAMKHRGLFEPEKSEVRMIFDFDRLVKDNSDTIDVDVGDVKIKQLKADSSSGNGNGRSKREK
jgi:phage terminase small subunit